MQITRPSPIYQRQDFATGERLEVTLIARPIAVLTSIAALVIACAPRARSTTPTADATAIAASTGSLAEAPDRFLVNGDVRLRYREIGRGDPVVLLHGATRRLDDWVLIGDSLAVEYRVIALDQRGHGQSSKFIDRAHFGAAMVDDVVRLLDSLHIQRAHLVGHSLGAIIAANVTARYPTRVITVSLVAPPLYADSAAYMQVHAAGIADLERGAGMARLNQIVFPGMPDSVAAASSVEILAANPAPTLAAIFGAASALMIPPSAASAMRGVPTLIAVGTDDPLLRQARWLASWWPDARLIEVPGANHGSVIGRPEVWAAIRRQLHLHAASHSPGS